MQLADVYELLILLFLVYAVVIGQWRWFPMKYEHYSTRTIRYIASCDTSVVGPYDDKFKMSLTRLLEHIFQKLYSSRGMTFKYIAEKLHEWEADHTYDPDLKIHCLIDEVCYNLEKRWDDYKQLRNDDRQPFNVDVSETDLPSPASTLRCNDHIDTASLYAFYYDLLRSSDG